MDKTTWSGDIPCTTSYCSYAAKDEQLAKANARVAGAHQILNEWEYAMVGGNTAKEDIPYDLAESAFRAIRKALQKDQPEVSDGKDN